MFRANPISFVCAVFNLSNPRKFNEYVTLFFTIIKDQNYAFVWIYAPELSSLNHPNRSRLHKPMQFEFEFFFSATEDEARRWKVCIRQENVNETKKKGKWIPNQISICLLCKRGHISLLCRTFAITKCARLFCIYQTLMKRANTENVMKIENVDASRLPSPFQCICKINNQPTPNSRSQVVSF